MKNAAQYMIPFFVCILLAETGMAQRISFGSYASEDITLTALNLGELNFSQKQYIILAGQTVTINLIDNETAALVIEAQANLDVTVTIDAPATIDMDNSNKIPLALRFAYSNEGKENETAAKTSSIQVPVGFSSITFPVLRRASGAPAPPPTPGHVGYSARRAKAYLFIFGMLGPVPANAAVGLYAGNLNVRVEYAK